MAGFNGSGVYVRPYVWVNDKANGIDITASRFDTDGNDVAGGLSNCICKDGQQTTTARIPFAVGLSFAGASGVVPTGDLTTGMFQPGSSGELDFYSVGTQVATINANGLDNTVIGAGTPLAGSFTALAATSLSGLTTFNKVTLTAPATGSTLTIVDGKTLQIDNTLEFAGTDSTVMTFPAASDTVVTLAATQTLTNKTLTAAALGSSTATTQTAGDSSTKVATTAFVNGTALTLATGTTAVTQSAADNSTNVATTAYADNAAKTLSGIILLSTVNASAAASVVFDSTYITSTYNKYIVEFDGVYFSSTGSPAGLGFAISTNNGLTYLNSGYSASNGIGSNSSMTGSLGITMSGATDIGFLQSSSATKGTHGTFKFSKPSAAAIPVFRWDMTFPASSSFVGGGSNSGTTAMNAISFSDTSGNSANISGNFHLYGIAGT